MISHWMMRHIMKLYYLFKVDKPHTHLSCYWRWFFVCKWRRFVLPLSRWLMIKPYIFQETKVILALVFTFYFVCWSQLPLNMLVSFRCCTKIIRCCFCNRKIFIQKYNSACFSEIIKNSMSGQIKDKLSSVKKM